MKRTLERILKECNEGLALDPNPGDLMDYAYKYGELIGILKTIKIYAEVKMETLERRAA